MAKELTSARANLFTESLIREMTRVNDMHQGINLAQGFPDFDPPKPVIEAAKLALEQGYNQYAITWGSPRLRKAIAEKFAQYNGLTPDPDKHVTVTCGSTEAMMATMLATVNPGEEVIIFEPFYENYGPDTLLAGARPIYIALHRVGDSFNFDPEELKKAFSNKTKAIVINTPHNPTGKVYSREELQLIADLCLEFDAIAISDEPYEHILYDGATHHSIAALKGMASRSITVNSVSKTYSATGWRVGWAIVLNEAISTGIRRVHDFLTVGAAAPLQEAAAVALRLPPTYYQKLARDYQARRDLMVSILDEFDLSYVTPQGAYYVMIEYPSCGYDDDLRFSHFLSKDIGVTPVPGRAFYHSPELGKRYIRFAFPKKLATLEAVRTRLSKLSEFRR